jgi:hypothetical protein
MSFWFGWRLGCLEMVGRKRVAGYRQCLNLFSLPRLAGFAVFLFTTARLPSGLPYRVHLYNPARLVGLAYRRSTDPSSDSRCRQRRFICDDGR